MEKTLRLKRSPSKKSLQVREYVSLDGRTKITAVRGRGRDRREDICHAMQMYFYDLEIADFCDEKRSWFSPDDKKAVRELLEDKKVMEDAFTDTFYELRSLRAEIARYESAFQAIREAVESDQPLSIDYTLVHILEPVKELQKRSAIEGQEKYRQEKARGAALARHSSPDGSHAKRDRLQEIWASGKYTSRDICAEQECGNLGVSFSTARRYLYGTPEPS